MPPSEGQPPLTYAGVGVDLEGRRRIVERYSDVAKRARRPEVLAGIGPFAGLFALDSKYREPVIVASTDGVGTKVKLAALVERYEPLGHDVVNQSVNDAITCGAEPLLFLDYIASADLTPDAKVALVKGVADACAAVGCALLGGETADMPALYAPRDFDLVGFVVGVVERDSIIDGSTIAAGDALFGLPSNGLHTNGYTLARAALGLGLDAADQAVDRERLERHEAALGTTLAEALLRPHRAYYTELKGALPQIKGMAHITAGGLEENVPRMLPAGLGARFQRNAWPVPPIFPYIQTAGRIEEEEMYRVFNMGLGLVIAVAPAEANQFRQLVPEALEVGAVVDIKGAEPAVAWS